MAGKYLCLHCFMKLNLFDFWVLILHENWAMKHGIKRVYRDQKVPGSVAQPKILYCPMCIYRNNRHDYRMFFNFGFYRFMNERAQIEHNRFIANITTWNWNFLPLQRCAGGFFCIFIIYAHTFISFAKPNHSKCCPTTHVPSTLKQRLQILQWKVNGESKKGARGRERERTFWIGMSENSHWFIIIVVVSILFSGECIPWVSGSCSRLWNKCNCVSYGKFGFIAYLSGGLQCR